MCFSTDMSRNPGCPSGGICYESMLMMLTMFVSDCVAHVASVAHAPTVHVPTHVSPPPHSRHPPRRATSSPPSACTRRRRSSRPSSPSTGLSPALRSRSDASSGRSLRSGSPSRSRRTKHSELATSVDYTRASSPYARNGRERRKITTKCGCPTHARRATSPMGSLGSRKLTLVRL
jgi:hypothetical protein